jgi:uncharacterized protein
LDLISLCGFAFLAGFIDSIAGGGGLIQIPALFLYLPPAYASNVALVFGTNKLSSICGTATAMVQYSRHITINWKTILPAGMAAFVFSFLGARVVSIINGESLRPVILVLMIVVAVYTYLKKDFGNLHAPHLKPAQEKALAVVVGTVIGFYDGFFGPGTGSFLVFAFIGLFGFSFLHASASAKIINFSTNLSAIACFASSDQVLYSYGLPMGACNLLGSVLGTRVAILKGNQFVRILFLVVVSILIARFGYDILKR